MKSYLYRYNPKTHEVATCENVDEWAKHWSKLKQQDKRVARTKVGKETVSTVFLGMDHGWGRRLLLFETAIVDKENGVCVLDRYPTHAEAIQGHEGIVRRLRARRKQKAA